MQDELGERLAALVEERLVKALPKGPECVAGCLANAQADLERASKSLAAQDWKWATVQAYYAAFGALTALLMARGYDECGHRRLATALERSYVALHLLSPRLLADFRKLIEAREDALYEHVHTPAIARRAVATARAALREAVRILQQEGLAANP